MNSSSLSVAEKICSELGIKGKITPLGHSTQNNINWQISNKVLKVFQPNQEDQFDEKSRWQKEYEALNLVDSLDIAPKLLKNGINENGHQFILREYVKGKIISDNSIKIKDLEQIVKTLVRLHNSFRIQRKKTEVSSLGWFITRCDQIGEIFFSFFEKRPKFDRYSLQQIQEDFNRSKNLIVNQNSFKNIDFFSLIHGDLVISNIILDETRSKAILIDWEYSGYHDPVVDISYFIMQNPGVNHYREDFINLYLELIGNKEDETDFRKRILEFDIILDWLVVFWYGNRIMECTLGKRNTKIADYPLEKIYWKEFDKRLTRISSTIKNIDEDESKI